MKDTVIGAVEKKDCTCCTVSVDSLNVFLINTTMEQYGIQYLAQGHFGRSTRRAENEIKPQTLWSKEKQTLQIMPTHLLSC